MTKERLLDFLPPTALVAALLAAALIGLRARVPPEAPLSQARAEASESEVEIFRPGSAAELAQLLEAAYAETDSEDGVPSLAPRSLPPGLEQLPLEEKKHTFFRAILPYVLAANRAIREDRQGLEAVAARVRAGEDLGEEDQVFVEDIAERYRISEDLPRAERLRKLLERVDVVPPSLALAQAAMESGWGSSRFVLEGNNLFGQWVFSAEAGMAPAGRPEGAEYSVARYGSLGEAVRAYMRNLNSFWAYESFRKLRRKMRRAGEALNPYRLAQGLRRYSTRRDEYVDEIRSIIYVNDLTRFDGRHLVPVDGEKAQAAVGETGEEASAL